MRTLPPLQMAQPGKMPANLTWQKTTMSPKLPKSSDQAADEATPLPNFSSYQNRHGRNGNRAACAFKRTTNLLTEQTVTSPFRLKSQVVQEEKQSQHSPGPMCNSVEHAENARCLRRTMSQIPTHQTIPSPNSVKSWVHSYRTTQQVKNNQGASKEHRVLISFQAHPSSPPAVDFLTLATSKRSFPAIQGRSSTAS